MKPFCGGPILLNSIRLKSRTVWTVRTLMKIDKAGSTIEMATYNIRPAPPVLIRQKPITICILRFRLVFFSCRPCHVSRRIIRFRYWGRPQFSVYSNWKHVYERHGLVRTARRYSKRISFSAIVFLALSSTEYQIFNYLDCFEY